MRLSTIASAAVALLLASSPLFANGFSSSQSSQTSFSTIRETAGGVSLSFAPSAEMLDQQNVQLQSSNSDGETNWERSWIVLPPTGGVEATVKALEVTRLDGSPVLESAISSSTLKPLVRMGRPMVFRGVRMAPVSMATSLTEGNDRLLVRHAEIEIEYTAGRGISEVSRPPQQLDADWHAFLQSTVSNPQSPYIPRRDLAPTNAGKLLILRPAALEDRDALLELSRYAEWKRQTGLQVTTEIVDVANTSPQQIRRIIAEGYPDDPYDFVLLIGWERTFAGDELMGPIENDASLLFPGFWLDGETPDTGDFFYGTLDDLEGESDWLPDVMVGRMMVQNPAKLRGALNRSIMYEQEPYVGVEGHEGEWFSHAMVVNDIVDSLLGVFVPREMAVWVRNSLNRIGMNADTLLSDKDHPSDVREIFESPGASIAIVDGYFFGACQWDDDNRFPLDNGMNPLVSANSLYYDTPTCYPYFSSVEFPDRSGPIAWISSAALHIFEQDRYVNGGVVRALTQRRTNLVGDLNLSGILEVLTLAPFFDDGDILAVQYHRYLRQFSLAGDPTVQVYTASPVELQTNLPNSLSPGTTALNIRVTNADGQDVPGAKVCIRQPDLFQYVSTTDDGGEVSFIIPEGVEAGVLQVTITKVNCRALIRELPVESGRVNLVLQDSGIDDSENGGDNDGSLDNGESVALNVTIANLGEDNATGVQATIRSNSPYVRFNREIVGVDDIESGGGTGTFSEPVILSLDSDCPGLTEIALQIELTSQQGNYLCGFELTSSGPVYATNPDQLGIIGLQPGAADATITPRLYNHGDRDGADLQVRLVSRTRGVDVTVADRAYNGVPVGSWRNPSDPFHLSVNRYFAAGELAEFEMRITEGENANFIHRFSIPVGVKGAGEPVGPDSHGYYAFDSGDANWPQSPDFEWFEINGDATGGSDVRGTKLDLTDGTNWSLGSEDSGMDTIISLPFDFQFYGQDYEQLVICTNGWVSFDTASAFFRSPFNRAFPGMGTPDAQIALCWQDLISDNNNFSGVYTYYHQQAGKFIVEWSGYNIYESGEYVPVSFQLWLLDPAIYPTPSGDGEAIIQYKEYTPTVGNTSYCPYAAVGIRNQDGTDGLSYLHLGQYNTAAAAITDSFAIKFTTMLQPERGRVFGRTVLAETPNEGAAGIHIFHPRGIDFTTAADGQFSFELPAGTYSSVEFTREYHNTSSITFTIRDGQEVNLGDVTITHPELIPPDSHLFDLRPDGSPTDRSIKLENRGNGPLDYSARIINADSTEPDLRMLGYVPIGSTLRLSSLGSPVYRADTELLYISVNTRPEPLIYGFNLAGDVLDTVRQPYGSAEITSGISSMTWDGEHFWGTLKMRDDSFRLVEFTVNGQPLRSVGLPNRDPVSIVYAPERGTLFMASLYFPLVEVSVAEGHLGEQINSWQVGVTLEEFQPTGLGWNPNDAIGMPLYIIHSKTDTSASNKFPRRLLRMNPDENTYTTWGNLEGAFVQNSALIPSIRGLSVVPNYSTSRIVVAGVDIIGTNTGWDTLRFYDIGPQTPFLVGGLQRRIGSVPARTVGDIGMHFEATGMAEGTYSFAVKIIHNAQGDSAIVPVTMVVDSAAAVENEPALPGDFGIAGAFPNPFNSELTVRFKSPTGTHTSLRVFDLSGREVGTLFEGKLLGPTRLTWQASGLPSGIYIVRLEAGGRVDQVKAALVK